MQTITNETIIKATKAAGLDVIEKYEALYVNRVVFNPLHNDTDNAMIRRGAEIDAMWIGNYSIAATYAVIDGRVKPLQFKQEFESDKAQSEREAVILCAAAKWDAMNGGVK